MESGHVRVFNYICGLFETRDWKSNLDYITLPSEKTKLFIFNFFSHFNAQTEQD